MLDALYAAVHASPDDDAPRAVLADALQDAGDPRGELIALQLREAAGTATPEMRARVQSLIVTHGRRWLGDVRPIARYVEFRRGFLDVLQVQKGVTDEAIERAKHDPAIATVERLSHQLIDGGHLARLLGGRLAASVRWLPIFDEVSWQAIATTPLPRLRALMAFDYTRDATGYVWRFVHDVMPYLAAHPAIVELGCAARVVSKLTHAVTDRLEALIVPDLTSMPTVELWRSLPKLRRLVCAHGEVELVREGNVEHARVFRADLVGIDPVILDQFQLVVADRPRPSASLGIENLRTSAE